MNFKSLALGLFLACALSAQQPPTILGMTPDTVIAGTGGVAIHLYGMDFQQGATAYWNNTPIGGQPDGPQNTVGLGFSAFIPQNLLTVGTAQVTVRNPGSVFSNSVTFTVRTTPATPNFVGATTSVTYPVRQLFCVGTGIQPGVIVRLVGMVKIMNGLKKLLVPRLMPFHLRTTPG
jgi:hypothetical protein